MINHQTCMKIQLIWRSLKCYAFLRQVTISDTKDFLNIIDLNDDFIHICFSDNVFHMKFLFMNLFDSSIIWKYSFRCYNDRCLASLFQKEYFLLKQEQEEKREQKIRKTRSNFQPKWMNSEIAPIEKIDSIFHILQQNMLRFYEMNAYMNYEFWLNRFWGCLWNFWYFHFIQHLVHLSFWKNVCSDMWMFIEDFNKQKIFAAWTECWYSIKLFKYF